MEAIQEIAEGGAVMSPEVAIRVLGVFRKAPVREAEWVGLSPREIRRRWEAVARALRDGLIRRAAEICRA
jgi:DNA-binding NarL/FixJ family response regulator